jgi:hypothetical protein
MADGNYTGCAVLFLSCLQTGPYLRGVYGLKPPEFGEKFLAHKHLQYFLFVPTDITYL